MSSDSERSRSSDHETLTSTLGGVIDSLARTADQVAKLRGEISRLMGHQPTNVAFNLQETAPTPGTISVDVLSNGAIPLPVGATGTTVIENQTGEAITLKTGTSLPQFPTPGTIRVDIPAGQSAPILQIPNAEPLSIEVASYTVTDPCADRPVIPGVISICTEPIQVQRQVKSADAIAAGTPWPAKITVTKTDAGFSLTRG